MEIRPRVALFFKLEAVCTVQGSEMLVAHIHPSWPRVCVCLYQRVVVAGNVCVEAKSMRKFVCIPAIQGF